MTRRVVQDSNEQQRPSDLIRMVRGAILVALAQAYPGPGFRHFLNYLVSDFGLTVETFDAQLKYLESRGWITTKPVRLVGRNDLRIDLTPDGYDVANGIDPQEPIL
jgi:DNA-binding MarR family transcriptional regulator